MIHAYQLNGYHIILDVYSGSVHLVDEVAFDLIQLYENKSAEEVIELLLERYAGNPDVTREALSACIEQVEALRRAGKLYTEDLYAGKVFDFKGRNGVIKALCLHVAHTCNLTCDYCFASQGKYHGERALMTFEVGKQALDFLISHSGNRVNLEVDFFGGEPLMNWEVVKQLVAYARSREEECHKKFRFYILQCLIRQPSAIFLHTVPCLLQIATADQCQNLISYVCHLTDTVGLDLRCFRIIRCRRAVIFLCKISICNFFQYHGFLLRPLLQNPRETFRVENFKPVCHPFCAIFR